MQFKGPLKENIGGWREGMLEKDKGPTFHECEVVDP